MKTGKIVAYQPNGQAEIKGMQYNRFKVTFADGQEYKFLAKGEFKKQIGERVQYEVINEEYKNAKFIQENTYNRPNNNSTNDSIMLQVCYKSNMDVFGKDNREQVHKFTEEDFLWMTNFFKNYKNG